VLRRYKPIAETIADKSNTPCGDKRCTIGPAKPLPTTITPVVSVNMRMALFVKFFNSTSIHCPVNNSVTAVPNIQINITINRGDSTALYISVVEYPEATRSVTGNFKEENR